MNRRELMLVAAGMMATGRGLRAQQKAMPVIGYLNGTTPEANAAQLAAFRQGVSESGWVEGQNLKIEYRWAEFHYERLPGLAADLVSHKVDVIAACGGADEAFVAKDATSTIPTVFMTGPDPVETGLATSLARPGGNRTGVTNLTQLLWQKRVELIAELVPQTRVIGLLLNPNRAGAQVGRVIRFCETGSKSERRATRDPEGQHRSRDRRSLRDCRATANRSSRRRRSALR